jgi:hypothetical protein
VPFNQSVSLGSEAGVPIVESNASGAEAQCFNQLADQLAARI